MTASPKRSLTPSSRASTSASSSTSRSSSTLTLPSKETSTSPPSSPHTPSSAQVLIQDLRRRRPSRSSRQLHKASSPSLERIRGQQIDQSNKKDMFSSRKYSPLPTSADARPRKRAGGGMAGWKRWGMVGTAVLVLLVIGYGYSGKGEMSGEAWEAENTYTPVLDEGLSAEDDEGFLSPPFRPLDSEFAKPKPHDTPSPVDEEEESSGDFSILPIGDDGSNVQTNPHDPTSDEAKVGHGATPDFTEITNEEPTLPAVHSFETDPDAASTTQCEDAYDETKPLVQYALTIDAGSTGSRIHVYKFHNCGPSPQLEYETFKSIQPGLSAYARDPTAAAASLDPLLEEAMRVVPKSLHKCTPVEVKATAGLRLLGTQESEAILDEVRNRLETNWAFVVPNEKSVEIMDGKDEGVYAWITANYLLNKIGEGSVSGDTLAVMDLGGASTQIVFEPSFPADSGQALVEGEHKYQLNFGGKQFTLYQHSYLGYGLMRARRSVHNLIAFTWSFGQGSNINWDELSAEAQVPNPCLSRGTTRMVELDPPGRKSVNVTMHGATGGFEACNRIVELVMAKDAICEVKPCSFNGVYQPSLLDTFPKGQFLALSYFTDRIQPLLQKTGDHITIADVTSLAKDVCAGKSRWETRWAGNSAALAELEDRPEYCLDLTFMNALLGLGYELGPERQLLVEKKLKGVELGWALGAGLALVEKAELTCTA